MARKQLWEQVDDDLYELLGVDPGATADDINSAWRSTAKRLHPDLGGDVAAFQNAEIAYQVLSDPLERAQYDRLRRNLGQTQGPRHTTYSTSANERSYRTTYTYYGSGKTRPSGTGYQQGFADTMYFRPDSPDPYGDAARRPPRKKRNPWFIALMVLVSVILLVAATALALVTFLFVMIAVALFAGRGLRGNSSTTRGR